MEERIGKKDALVNVYMSNSYYNDEISSSESISGRYKYSNRPRRGWSRGKERKWGHTSYRVEVVLL